MSLHRRFGSSGEQLVHFRLTSNVEDEEAVSAVLEVLVMLATTLSSTVFFRQLIHDSSSQYKKELWQSLIP